MSTAKRQCRGGGCDPIGFLVFGPITGWLSDRFGAHVFAIGGLMLVATTFVASLMTGTFQNAEYSLSIGIFFSLMIAGPPQPCRTCCTQDRPRRIDHSGLSTGGIGATIAKQMAATPPVGNLFATFLGCNPIEIIPEPTGLLNSLSW